MTMNGMTHYMMMPGMLTEEQMAQLDAARGVEFDRLFLTFMIQHHRGAITMVDSLFNTPGAGQDEIIFKFANDVQADQTHRDRPHAADARGAAGGEAPRKTESRARLHLFSPLCVRHHSSHRILPMVRFRTRTAFARR